MQDTAATLLVVQLLLDAPESEHASAFRGAAWMLLAGALKRLETADDAAERIKVSILQWTATSWQIIGFIGCMKCDLMRSKLQQQMLCFSLAGLHRALLYCVSSKRCFPF